MILRSMLTTLSKVGKISSKGMALKPPNRKSQTSMIVMTLMMMVLRPRMRFGVGHMKLIVHLISKGPSIHSHPADGTTTAIMMRAAGELVSLFSFGC